MNLIQARELTIKYLEPFLAQNHFSVKVYKNKEALIERKTKNGRDRIGYRLLNYNPSYTIEYGFSKINDLVSSIMMQLQSKVKLQFEYDKNSRFLFFSYNTINNPSQSTYLPSMSSESDIRDCCGRMIDFMTNTAFPLLDRFEDLRELDKVINGEDPWDDDWFKPYYVGNNFGLYRLVIARLAGNAGFDGLVDLNYRQREMLSAKNGYPYTYDRNNLSKPLPALIELLKTIQPV